MKPVIISAVISVCLALGVRCNSGAERSAREREGSTNDTASEGRSTKHLKRFLRQNFRQTTWYDDIKTAEVFGKSVEIATNIYPDADADIVAPRSAVLPSRPPPSSGV